MSNKGFTIIESMIAMIILGIIMVSVSSLYQYIIRKNERQEQKTHAAAMVMNYMESVKEEQLLHSVVELEPYSVVNGDTLYYKVFEDISETMSPEQEVKTGKLYVICKNDTLFRVQTTLLKENHFE